jgi:hypothetical protein
MKPDIRVTTGKKVQQIYSILPPCGSRISLVDLYMGLKRAASVQQKKMSILRI